MITIIDYGIGNIGSIINMLTYIGVKSRATSDPDKIYNSTKLILPGVGSFDTAMHKINNINGLKESLSHKVLKDQIPLMGICLGMQLITNSSEEGKLPGLGWIDANAKKFPVLKRLKVPHMGWNNVRIISPNKITKNLSDKEKYYFVHSYYVSVKDQKYSLMKTKYGLDFDSGIFFENIYGFQFHPEKSNKYGMKLLKNFSEI
jgi:glutamine amidotransferase